MRSAILVTAMIVAACNSSDGTDGELGGHCYPNGTCNATLACSAGVCVPLQALPDAAVDASIVIPDAPVCSMLYEPNESIATAHPLTGATNTLTGLAICSNIDKDTFQLTITQLSNLDAITTVASGTPVAVSILNAGGATLVNGTSSGAGSLRALAANLPAGTYYVQTYGNIEQAYSLMTTVTAQ
jgi:hypothetical protein